MVQQMKEKLCLIQHIHTIYIYIFYYKSDDKILVSMLTLLDDLAGDFDLFGVDFLTDFLFIFKLLII
jgi:hypothetical protein